MLHYLVVCSEALDQTVALKALDRRVCWVRLFWVPGSECSERVAECWEGY